MEADHGPHHGAPEDPGLSPRAADPAAGLAIFDVTATEPAPDMIEGFSLP
jgi:hypothetical protein